MTELWQIFLIILGSLVINQGVGIILNYPQYKRIYKIFITGEIDITKEFMIKYGHTPVMTTNQLKQRDEPND